MKGEYVFISYSSKNYDTAAELRRVVEANGIACWMAPQSIPAGGDYASEIPVAIQNCSAFVLVLSEEAQLSRWVPKELDLAITYDRPVIPVHTDNADVVQAFNFRLTNVQRIEAYRRLNDALSELIARLNSVCGFAPEASVCPINKNSFASANRWDTVCFGRYDNADVEWLVLEKAAGRMLLLSKKVLDTCPGAPFSLASGWSKDTSAGWEHSILRQWLNVTFLESSFTPNEADKILTMDRVTEKYSCVWEDERHSLEGNDPEHTAEAVFVLPLEEVKRYFPWHKKKYLRAETGAAIVKQNNWHGEFAPWCLRGTKEYTLLYRPASNDSRHEEGIFYPVVDWKGRILKVGGRTSDYWGVRPAIWVRYE